jgi:glycosyltransferase involved in cell wall biosynthesis/GT2 family glycosyltransferase
MPRLSEHFCQDFVERYCGRHSDYVIAPSRFMADWVGRQGWQLTREPEILGLPFLPRHGPAAEPQVKEFKRLIYFGRLQRLKGFDLLVNALLQLNREAPDALVRLDELVLLGHEDEPGAAKWVREALRPAGLTVNHIGNFDSAQAQDYLARHVADALVVVASAFENFPYAVIETSQISGLNVICSRGGGTPEIFSTDGDAQLFAPTPEALAAKIRERLNRPLSRIELARYDFASHNDRWLEFHDRICGNVSVRPPAAVAKPAVTVDVCVTYFNKARHFPQLLQSLELQTFAGFRLIAVDDGSTDPKAAALFDYMEDEYRDRGWIFFRQNRQFLDAARNRLAERASAEYLLFADADDVLAPNAIERLVEAAQNSGEDCLRCGILRFAGDQFPYDKRTGRVVTSVIETSMPLGPALTAAIFDPSVLGSSFVLVRRAAFEAVGGYRELRTASYAGAEDWEFYVKLAASGYQTDVVPDYLYYYRQSANSLSQKNDPHLAKRRLIGQFDMQLATVGLGGAAAAVLSNLEKVPERNRRAEFLSHQLKLGHERFNVFGFNPLADGPVSSAVTMSHRPRTKVLVIVPTLGTGGAEMDLLRNLPRLNRGRFEIIVFVFLTRGDLAAKVADTGIEIVGPLLSSPLRWLHAVLGRAASELRLLSHRAGRSLWQQCNELVSLAPEVFHRAWRQLRAWLQLRSRRPRMRALRTKLLRIRSAMRRSWVVVNSELKKSLSLLADYCKQIFRLVPQPLIRLVKEALAWPTYAAIGLALVPFVRWRQIDVIHTVLPNSYIVGSVAKYCCRHVSLIMVRVGLNWHQANKVFDFVERRLCHRKLDAAIANCDAILAELRNEGIPESKLHLVRNGIDVAEFSWQMINREGARSNLGVFGDLIAISVVANLHLYKGHADLLNALHLVRHEMPGFVLLLVGRDVGGNRTQLERLAKKLGMFRAVRFLGARADVPAILSASDIHVSASHTEGLPNNVLEAMCARLPVVATAVGGVGELVLDRETGLLVPPHDPISLGRAILALARHPVARRRMGELARARAAEHFAIDRSVAAFEGLYARATSESRQHDEPSYSTPIEAAAKFDAL